MASGYFGRDTILGRAFCWQNLRKFGSSKIVKSSYYLIFIIPLIAKVANYFHFIIVGIPGFENFSDFSLPFSWYLLYFGALSFALASLLYDIFCPRIISMFRNFRDFLDSGYQGLFLVDELESNVLRYEIHDSPIYWAFTTEWKKIHGKDQEIPGIDPHAQVQLGIREIDKDNLGGIFYTCTEVVNYSHPRILQITGFFYYFGFGLLAIILFQNIHAVFMGISIGELLF